MANPAAEARAKIQGRWPGASIFARGRKSITHQHPTNPNKFALDHIIGPMHYGVDNDQEIDTGWQAKGGGFWDYEVTANDFHCFVRDSVPVSYRYLDVTSGEDVELEVDAIKWVNDSGQQENITNFSQVTPVIADDRITWPNISTGWDVTVQAGAGSLAKLINIDSLANLGSPTLGGTVWFSLVYRFKRAGNAEIYINDVLWDERSNNPQLVEDDIEFRLSGQSLFWFRRPFALSNADGPEHDRIELCPGFSSPPAGCS